MRKAYFDWKAINNPLISYYGDWVCYQIKPGHGDPTLALYNTANGKTDYFERGTLGSIYVPRTLFNFQDHSAKDSLGFTSKNEG